MRTAAVKKDIRERSLELSEMATTSEGPASVVKRGRAVMADCNGIQPGPPKEGFVTGSRTRGVQEI